jgi:hypothetical protein
MLLDFKAENIRSYRDELELSMVASTLSEPYVRRSIPWREDGKTVDVLPVAGLFGGNASGKTNALRVMNDMRSFVLASFRLLSPTGGIPRLPFLLSSSPGATPTRFEIDLILDGIRHQYGFVLDDERVLEEWAYTFPKGRASALFTRNGDDVEIGRSLHGRGRSVIDLLRPNALFLSTAAAANNSDLLPLYAWFDRNLLLAEVQTRPMRQLMTLNMLRDGPHRRQVLDFLREADLGITGAKPNELDPELKGRLEQAVRILVEGVDLSLTGLDPDDAEFAAQPFAGASLIHEGSDGEVAFGPENESYGTQVWFGLIGPIIKVLSEGSVFLADELDASLHPTLVAHIIALFQDPETNPRRAQLIFNSHDTSLLGNAWTLPGPDGKTYRLLGRDQIWFTEKSRDGATRLYPLSDMGPRKDEAIETRYIAGRYGGVPVVARERLGAIVLEATDAESER